MTILADLVDRFVTQERPAGNILDPDTVLAQAVAATEFYAGFAELAAHANVTTFPDIDDTTNVSRSEWALIRPLFLLYVERETSLQLEASRGLGMDVFGRSSSEVASDITMKESELPRLAFSRKIITF